MRLDSYAAARPWAKAIRQAVVTRTMPPWLADPAHGKFANDSSLSEAEIRMIAAWAAAAPKVEIRAAPPAQEWNIGRPDAVFTMPRPIAIPAQGAIDYQYVPLPTRFEHDAWIQSVEVRPSDQSVVHHAVVYIREPGSTWIKGPTMSDVLMVYTPGNSYDVWPAGMAKKIKAGSDLVLQMHYTVNGQPAQDQTRIGVTLASQSPAKAILTLQLNQDRFVIPPGDPNYRVQVFGTLPNDALLLSMFPHMHLRGKAFEYAIAGPNGQYETLLSVPRYDFHWQLNYKLATPRLLRAGTRLVCTARFDNSPNNPNNPDPTAEVRYGEQSWEEMMIGFFDVAVDADVDKPAFFVRR